MPIQAALPRHRGMEWRIRGKRGGQRGHDMMTTTPLKHEQNIFEGDLGLGYKDIYSNIGVVGIGKSTATSRDRHKLKRRRNFR